ncbi:50S ribosomal protein L18e [Candidatus Micrarchaeota archaeon]|nr:50S ribosomal protein L18e [Candidatus Micrarchaeota archaeon]
MMKDNETLGLLLNKLSKNQKPIWAKVASELQKPRRSKIEVNLDKIEKFASANSVILVPGKVLGSGLLTKKVTIAAFSFSESAKKLIGQAGGKVVTIDSILESNPNGTDVLLLK